MVFITMPVMGFTTATMTLARTFSHGAKITSHFGDSWQKGVVPRWYDFSWP